jgi:putative ABC transport system permease protein
MILLLRFVLANLARSKARAIFTALTVMAAFTLFGLLLSFDRVFNVKVKSAGAERLIVANKSSIAQPLPLSYKNRIAQVDNVEFVAPFLFMGTFFQDPNQQVVTIATEPDSYVHMIPELKFLDPSQRDVWYADRASIMVGRELANKYNWKVGDLLPLYSVIYPKRDGTNTWTFRVAAIFDSDKGNTKSAAIHMDYFDELRLFGHGYSGWFVVKIKDTSKGAQTAAQIEALFANSPFEVKAGTEDAFTNEFMSQIGDFGLMISLALAAVFSTLALVAANTMAQSVNERASEMAVLKTIGFGSMRIFGLVYAEGFIMVLFGGLAGMALAAFCIPFAAEQIHLADNMAFRWGDLLYAALSMFVLVTVSAFVPAVRAARAGIVDGLEKAA